MIVPLCIGFSVELALRERQFRWLSPVSMLGVFYVYWIWVYWTHPDRLDCIIGTSSYRVIDGAILLMAISIPFLAERLLQHEPSRRTLPEQGRKAQGVRVLCGLVGAGIALLAVKSIPPPNLEATSRASGYDLLTATRTSPGEAG